MSSFGKSLRRVLHRLTGGKKPEYTCPLCGYHGAFKDKRLYRSSEVRVSTKCLGCGSKERHRMMHLLFKEFFPNPGDAGKRLLHIAPEDFLRPFFKQRFETYHTADLFKQDVDFKEDLQKMSFPDGSYDCVVVSRVLTCPPDLEACIREIRRVLAPGGVAIIGEVHTHEKTVEFGKFVGERSREMGVDLFDLYRKHFARVELVFSDRYPEEYQLHNRITANGRPRDDYPELVRIPGAGYKDVLALCRA
jgi:SAM-dependent methyltransferase